MFSSLLPRLRTLCAPGLIGFMAGALAHPAHAQAPNPAGIDWVLLANFEIARTETTVGQFRRFVVATQTRTRAEAAGGGQIYEAGWVQKPGWVWSAPYGSPAADDEPAVHVSFDEAARFCRWAGGRLPTDAQWVSAAYTEQRAQPAQPFQTGHTYSYPTGLTPRGAHCLDDCGSPPERAVKHSAKLWRGAGHARVGTTTPGVNGLFDMGANVWEWVDQIDEPPATTLTAERRTRGGSWWYGQQQMRADHLQGKPPETTVAYIGFRCVRGF